MAIEIVNWLEIPVGDMKRARRFYEAIFEIELVDLSVGNEIYPCFPTKNGDSYSGALVQYEFTAPGKQGPLVYLNASPDMEAMLQRISSSGGTIIQDKTEIASGLGYFALFEDTEGNRLALQSES